MNSERILLVGQIISLKAWSDTWLVLKEDSLCVLTWKRAERRLEKDYNFGMIMLNHGIKKWKWGDVYIYIAFADASGAGYEGYVECVDEHLFKESSAREFSVFFPQGDVSESTSRIVGNGRISEVTPERDLSDFHDIETTITKVCNSRVNRVGSPVVITKLCYTRF